MNFLSKARTIEKLLPLLKQSKVLPVFIFNIESFESNRLELLKKIQGFFSEDFLIVRSSAFDEDTNESSMAGHFDSVLNVDILDKKKISYAIDKVISSLDFNPKNEIFIQPMLQKMTFCGVAFTSDIDTLTPYYVINYDDSGSPDSVTSGRRGNLKTYIHLKENKDDVLPPVIQKLISSFNELEKIFENNFLDIEFGVNSSEEIFIFQVRPIVTKNKKNNYKLNLSEALFKVEKKNRKTQFTSSKSVWR